MRNPLAPTRLALGAAALAALAPPVPYAAPELAAQHRGKSAMHGGCMGHATMLERVLRHGDRLDLTDDQRGQLEELRVDAVEQRAEHAAVLIRLRSEARAGLLEGGAARDRLAEMRKASVENEKKLHEHFAAILTEEQMAGLKEATAKRGGGPRMRRGGVRGGHRGWMRGRGMRSPKMRRWQ